MFCPKCSQQQVSEETRFCSRCGFQLNVVKILLLNDDQSQNTEIRKKSRSFNMRDMTYGAALMFVFAFIVAAITVDLPPSHSARIAGLIIAWLILSLLINIKPLIRYFIRPDFSENEASASKAFPDFPLKQTSSALPSAQFTTAEKLVMPNFDTAEMIQPLSVTEPTTNLLVNKDKVD